MQIVSDGGKSPFTNSSGGNIPESEAVNTLISLIKTHGDWVDKN